MKDLSKSLSVQKNDYDNNSKFVSETKVNFELPQYSEIIEKCRDYIIAGDVIQVVVSKRTSKEKIAQGWEGGFGKSQTFAGITWFRDN